MTPCAICKIVVEVLGLVWYTASNYKGKLRIRKILHFSRTKAALVFYGNMKNFCGFFFVNFFNLKGI
jgi:hypothetical protein